MTLHHLLLDVAGGLLAFHSSTVRVLGVVEAEWTTTVRVALELLDGGSGIALTAKLDYTRATRAAIWLVLDFGAVDGADSLEELDQVVIASAPRQLE